MGFLSKNLLWTEEDIDIFMRQFKHDSMFNWTFIMHDWRDANIMLKRSSLKNVRGTAKEVALKLIKDKK